MSRDDYKTQNLDDLVVDDSGEITWLEVSEHGKYAVQVPLVAVDLEWLTYRLHEALDPHLLMHQGCCFMIRSISGKGYSTGKLRPMWVDRAHAEIWWTVQDAKKTLTLARRGGIYDQNLRAYVDDAEIVRCALVELEVVPYESL
jgi:hypothetical protein